MLDLKDKILSKAANLPCWHAPYDLSFLDGGKTNHNILLHDQGRQFVVRFGEDILTHGIMRWNECAIAKAAHGAGLAPAVHFSAPGILVLEFINAKPICADDLAHDSTLDALAQLLRHMHTHMIQHLHGPVLSFWVFHILRDYAHFLKSRNSPYQTLLPELAHQAWQLENSVGPCDIALCHNDLLAGNILYDQKRLWLIDWEYAGLGSPLFDLSGLSSNNGLNTAQEQRFLEHYHDAPLTGEFWHRYHAMKCASLLRETMWSMVSEMTSTLDIDYATYTQDNLAAYRAAHHQFRSL